MKYLIILYYRLGIELTEGDAFTEHFLKSILLFNSFIIVQLLVCAKSMLSNAGIVLNRSLQLAISKDGKHEC